jgi:hypothetical protein
MKLYEIKYIKHMLNLDGNHIITTTCVYQQPARSEIDAAMRFGQTFNNQDKYEITINYIRQVGK